MALTKNSRNVKKSITTVDNSKLTEEMLSNFVTSAILAIISAPWLVTRSYMVNIPIGIDHPKTDATKLLIFNDLNT